VKQENKALLTKYLVCFGIASAIAIVVFAIKGFFTDSLAVNIQILSDGFSVSGILFLLFAGMWYISGEGALIGIGYVMRNVALAFIPMGRKKQEVYAQYRERKLKEIKKSGDHCILLTGLVFFIIGAVLTVIWYMKFYNPSI
jgi:hypothetical protein